MRRWGEYLYKMINTISGHCSGLYIKDFMSAMIGRDSVGVGLVLLRVEGPDTHRHTQPLHSSR